MSKNSPTIRNTKEHDHMPTHPQTYNADSPSALITAIRAANPGKSETELRAIFLEYMKSEQGKVDPPPVK